MANEESYGEQVATVPCARYVGLAAARFVHPEGVCACFHGGPPPILLPTPGRSPEADHLGQTGTQAPSSRSV